MAVTRLRGLDSLGVSDLVTDRITGLKPGVNENFNFQTLGPHPYLYVLPVFALHHIQIACSPSEKIRG